MEEPEHRGLGDQLLNAGTDAVEDMVGLQRESRRVSECQQRGASTRRTCTSEGVLPLGQVHARLPGAGPAQGKKRSQSFLLGNLHQLVHKRASVEQQ